MATYYDYAERQEDAYVDWSAIGKQLSDKLNAENKFREEKKAKIDEDTRKFGNELSNPIQGEFKPASEFALDYANEAQQARLLQDKLLKSGQWSLKKYTIARQNLQDGTNNLFGLSKYYQDNFKSIMDAYNRGEIQALNIANLASVEGFADFAKSKGVINPEDGTVSMAGVYLDPKTGLKTIDKNIVPATVLQKKISTLIPTFQKDEEINKWKKSLGTMVESMYKSATLSGAGTITQLTGPNAISRYPQYAEEITNFNKSLNNTIESMFSNPYNLSSVLTENTGKYNDKSYIWDREEAKADPSKILLKIDPSTHLPILDNTAPHYKTQKKEAIEYMKTDMLSKLDSEVKITTTAQTQLQERSAANRQYGDEKASKEKQAENFGEQLANLVSGDKDKVDAAVKYFGGFGVDLKKTKGPKGAIEVSDKSGNFIPYTYGNKTPEELQKSVVSALNVNGLPEDLILKYASKYSKGRTVNTIDEFTAISKKEKPVEVDIPIQVFTTGGFWGNDTQSIELLQSKLPTGFTVKEGDAGNSVDITAPNGLKKTYKSNLSGDEAIAAQGVIKKWVEDNNVSTGVGSKYNEE